MPGLKRSPHPPLVRVVGLDLDATFLHGTWPENIRTLHLPRRPNQRRGSDCDEFAPELYLCEPRQPNQASYYASNGSALALVELRLGSRVLDLADEASRRPPRHKPHLLPNEPSTLRFFERPAVTDALLAFRRSAGLDTRGCDPALRGFDVATWEASLVPFARSQGLAAVRLADETLLVDRASIEAVRRASPAVHDLVDRTPPTYEQLMRWYAARPAGARAEASAIRAGRLPLVSASERWDAMQYHASGAKRARAGAPTRTARRRASSRVDRP